MFQMAVGKWEKKFIVFLENWIITRDWLRSETDLCDCTCCVGTLMQLIPTLYSYFPEGYSHPV